MKVCLGSYLLSLKPLSNRKWSLHHYVPADGYPHQGLLYSSVNISTLFFPPATELGWAMNSFLIQHQKQALDRRTVRKGLRWCKQEKWLAVDSTLIYSLSCSINFSVAIIYQCCPNSVTWPTSAGHRPFLFKDSKHPLSHPQTTFLFPPSLPPTLGVTGQSGAH